MTAPAPIVTTTTTPSPEHSRLGSKQHSDGGWGLVPVQVRSARFASFEVGDFEAVTGREVEWKYTPIPKIQPLLADSILGTPLEPGTVLGDGATVEWIERSDARVGSAGKPEERASAAAWSSVEKALAITVSGEDHSTTTVDRTGLGRDARAAHTVITATKHSNSTVILLGSGDAMFSENVEIIVEDGAILTVVTVQEWASDAVHLASHFAEVGRDAKLRHVVVSLGGEVVRVNPSVHLSSEGGSVELFGAYFADAGQYLEQQVFVNHDAPNTVSRVTYKGALQGEGAHTVWIGDVLIKPTASGTDSYEQNRNLLLTDGARADSVPNLEIETGDIAGAGHASASGRFDDEQLFYLQARGIEEHDARRLVVLGFLAEVVQKIGSPDLEARLQAVIESELAGNSGKAA
ncbi:Fe-S cluster assembly protein SufD [Lacisediminihabitans changchengi]|uniref:Fe-S cluster assembly protein SufD n=1 Tax=Lacisediminihabitans changchengi TaxID=2787634 RepID=A0A934W3V3_9MICO|nr:Fe-S cluster assembly protein SufD [Lacisediminihabitans changchengi]MBK4346860.1 Fe-S cluster assembly protein SufD [Lacisediminihabitans changchengi]MBK4348017.1 Fe-S cluster assembly protein SufD [Lacisediminihabitans changchengi]